MAKRVRQRDPRGTTAPLAGSTATGRPVRRSRPARRGREQGFFERHSGLLVIGLGAIGVLVIIFFLMQGTTRAAYECDTLLQPGPVETVTPRPSPAATPSPLLTPAASPAASPVASPAGSPPSPPPGSPPTTVPPSPGPSPAAAESPSPAASPNPAPSPSPGASPAAEPTPRLGFTTPILGRTHVQANQRVTYGFCPPTSGEHFAGSGVGPIRADFYGPAEERVPGGWVHNLEHGYVAALYRCPSDDDCPSDAELNLLRRFTQEAAPSEVAPQCASKVLAVRFDSMSTRFALVAWGRALLMDEFDLETALTFAEQWIDHEAVPERGVC